MLLLTVLYRYCYIYDGLTGDSMDLSINMCLYVLPLLFITLLSCFTPHYKRHKECIPNICVEIYLCIYTHINVHSFLWRFKSYGNKRKMNMYNRLGVIVNKFSIKVKVT